MEFALHHKSGTASTNADALDGRPGDVFTADSQSAGRGRLDHKWLSPPGENLLMSAVLPAAGLPPEHVSTIPLAIGLAVRAAAARLLPRGAPAPRLKWPNDVLDARGRKLAGVLCELHGERIIAGIGVNVRQTAFPPEIEGRATSLALLGSSASPADARDAVLEAISEIFPVWQSRGFAALHAAYREADALRGATVSVRQTDSDPSPVRGLCGGVLPDGSLLVGSAPVFAGEAHVEEFIPPPPRPKR